MKGEVFVTMTASQECAARGLCLQVTSGQLTYSVLYVSPISPPSPTEVVHLEEVGEMCSRGRLCIAYSTVVTANPVFLWLQSTSLVSHNLYTIKKSYGWFS